LSAFTSEVIPMTNHELRRLYESILDERERIKAERRATGLAAGEMTASTLAHEPAPAAAPAR
jgi:hypothetical protein